MYFQPVTFLSSGANAGNTENLSYIRTENGLQVKVMSLSPIAIGYAEKTVAPSQNTIDSTKDTDEYRSANTADQSGLAGWSFLMMTSVLVIALGLKWKHKMS